MVVPEFDLPSHSKAWLLLLKNEKIDTWLARWLMSLPQEKIKQLELIA